MIEFEGTISTELLRRARPGNALRLRLIAGLILAAAGIAGFLLQPPPLEPARHGLVVLIAVIGGAIATSALAKSRDVPEVQVRGSVSEQRLTIFTSRSEEHVQWSSFSAAVLGEDFAVLQQSPYFTFVLGREFFRDAASWEEFRAIVSRNVRVVEPQTMPRALMSVLLWLGIFALVFLIASRFA